MPLVIKVKSKLAVGFTSGSNATNTSSIDYQYAYDPDNDSRIPSQIPNDIPNIPNPNPDDPDPTDPNNPPVVSYPDGTEEDDELHNTETVTPATITISNYATGTTTELENGKYNITGCSEHNDADSDNMVTLSNLAPGVYEITQLGTKANYKIDDTVKTIFIDKDGTVYEGNAAVTGKELANNKVIFYNAPISDNFQLPFTGTTATIVFTIGGIAIMAGAAFFIIVLFKKKDEEEEEQNKA
ncbi:LPXTG cell wall anchor domain-containing protein [Ruminococcus sp.]|uniref:LPXTG cell wall anchor domain-containing protein n=1 Tax=Ruminococcus sp. TaxID=41978 RepID=UPI002588662D|nr:LPXTG cell wall anchor domain-containing protein [Ruminococcus sp.]MCR5020790.1 LPXTG cell wall anchor domain-containing protein [Ruminococcus sp.]